MSIERKRFEIDIFLHFIEYQNQHILAIGYRQVPHHQAVEHRASFCDNKTQILAVSKICLRIKYTFCLLASRHYGDIR